MKNLNFLEKANKVIKQNLEIDKNRIKQEYEYFILQGDSIVPNEVVNGKFGHSREGFEKFRKENNEFKIDVSGKLSLRSIYDYNKDCIGYVLEKRIDLQQENVVNIKKEYETILNNFIESLNIKDIENFKYYLEQNEEFDGFDGFNLNLIKSYSNKIKLLIEIYEKYSYDEDFKKYFDKIIY